MPRAARCALALLVLSASLAGCSMGQPDEHYAVGVVLRARYEGAFDEEAVREAAREAGWSARPGESPIRLRGLVVRPPDGPAMHATPALVNQSATPDLWELSLLHEFPEPVRQPDGAAAEAYARERGEALQEGFVARIAPLERAGGFERVDVNASCLCRFVIYG